MRMITIRVRNIFAALLLVAVFVSTSGMADAAVGVRGYFRKDGTYVQPHYRSSPDGNPYNNWSFPGNTNPYTGKVAPGNPDTYLDNYYNSDSSLGSGNSSYFLPSSSSSTHSSPSVLGTYSYTPSAPVVWSPSVIGSQLEIYNTASTVLCTIPNPIEPRPEVIKYLNQLYKCVNGREITSGESNFWHNRFTSDPNLITRARLATALWNYYINGKGTVLGASTTATVSGETFTNEQVPLIVEREFTKLFGRKPTKEESAYWKSRARSDKRTVSALRGAMLFHKAKGRTMPAVAVKQGSK